jgi:lipocalin
MLGKGTSRQLRETLDAVESARTALEALAAARRLREAAEALELAAVVEVRRQRGTWTEIGAVYHTSKQGAQQRFRAAVERARD